MSNPELKEAHRRSAARIRELLEELETAEEEFNRLTERIKALEPLRPKESPAVPLRSQP